MLRSHRLFLISLETLDYIHFIISSSYMSSNITSSNIVIMLYVLHLYLYNYITDALGSENQLNQDVPVCNTML